MKAENCVHGLGRYCDICYPPDTASKPRSKHIGINQVKEAKATQTRLTNLEMGVIQQKHDITVSISGLDPGIKILHSSGPLFIHHIDEIVARCPKLQTIQFAPARYNRISESFIKKCEANGIQVKSGIINLESALSWIDNPIRSPDYKAKYQFMQSLSPEQKILLDELVKLGFEEAELTCRYYCVGGEDYLSLTDLAVEFGITWKANSDSYVSMMINSVIHYLDSNYQTNEASVLRSEILTLKVKRLREVVAIQAWEKAFCEEVGISEIPNKFPLSKLDKLKGVALAQDSGFKRVSGKALRTSIKERNLNILKFRYGILDGEYKTLERVALEHGITRERVRQIEAEMLSYLGLNDD